MALPGAPIPRTHPDSAGQPRDIEQASPLFFAGHPEAWSCPASDQPPGASAFHSRLGTVSAFRSQTRGFRHKPSSSDKTPLPRSPSCGIARRPSSRPPPASRQTQSARLKIVSSASVHASVARNAPNIPHSDRAGLRGQGSGVRGQGSGVWGLGSGVWGLGSGPTSKNWINCLPLSAPPSPRTREIQRAGAA